jgi:transmembrane sensor
MSAGPDDSLEAIRDAAARWTVRRDRGLSAAEAIEFELWLAADPRHRAALERSGQAWSLLDRVPENLAQVELARETRRRQARRRVLGLGGLAAAAVFAVLTAAWWRDRNGATPPPAVMSSLVAAGPREVTLADGTLVRLNAGAEVIEDYTPEERRVRLTRGEAHFTVTPMPARPFLVMAGALRVQAVGTAFNVKFQAARVEVLVTEGSVRVASDQASSAEEPVVAAGERAVVARGSSGGAGATPAIVVERVDAAEITRALAWHDALVRLGGATLAELAREFEQRFGQAVTIADPEIAERRAGGRVRADNAEDFLNLLATTFDLEVDHTGDGGRVLRKKKSISR